MDDPVLRLPFQLIACHTLHRLRAPVGPHIAEDRRRVRHQVPQQHRRTVQAVVLRRHHKRLADPVPVERRAQDRFHEVSVRHEVRPLSLTLETGRNCIIPISFFIPAFCLHCLASLHHVTHDHRHLHAVFPLRVFLLPAVSIFSVVDILILFAVLLHPCQRTFIFFFVIDSVLHPPDDLAHILIFAPHPKIFLKEIRVYHASRDPHRHVSYRQV